MKDINHFVQQLITEHATSTPVCPPIELSLHFDAIFDVLNHHWNTAATTTIPSETKSDDVAVDTVDYISAASILLRCPSISPSCPFYRQTTIASILSAMSGSQRHLSSSFSPHTVPLVKLLFNICVTWRPAAKAVADEKGGVILCELLQRPMSAVDARLVCVLIERLVASHPAFPSGNLANVVLVMLRHVMITKKPKIFPHGQGRVELCLSLWNLLFAVITMESKRTSDENVSVDGMLDVVYVMLSLPDNIEGTVFQAQCAAINVLLHSRQSLRELCQAGAERESEGEGEGEGEGESGGEGGGEGKSTSVNDSHSRGRELYRAVVRACERWLIVYCVEKRRRKRIMDATLLPTVLILLRGMEDTPEIVRSVVESRLKGCDYLRKCVQSSMSTFGSSPRVSVAMGDLVMLLCENRPDVLMKFAGTGAAMGVLQRRGLLQSGGTGNQAVV